MGPDAYLTAPHRGPKTPGWQPMMSRGRRAAAALIILGICVGLFLLWPRIGYRFLEVAGQRDNSTLRRRILAMTPGLREALSKDRAQAATLLLDWASNAACFALDEKTDAVTAENLPSMSAADIFYSCYLPGRSGCFCGGTAIFFAKVARLFGYDGFVVDFGEKGLTHVTVALFFPEGKRPRYIIFDPTFNLTFRRRDGGLLDIGELIGMEHEGRLDEARVVTGDLGRRLFVRAAPGGGPAAEAVRDPGFSFSSFLERSREEYRRRGLAPGLDGFIRLLRTRIFNIRSFAPVETLLEFRSGMRALGITIEKPAPPSSDRPAPPPQLGGVESRSGFHIFPATILSTISATRGALPPARLSTITGDRTPLVTASLLVRQEVQKCCPLQEQAKRYSWPHPSGAPGRIPGAGP